MQPKLRRKITLIQMLEKILASVPIEKRLGLAIEFSTSEELLQRNLENIYNFATQRLLHLSYYLEWSRTIEAETTLKPVPLNQEGIDYLPHTFHDLETMTSDVLKFFNTSFSNWINNQTIRELNEFLKVYLGELYQVCTVLERTKTPIKPADVVDIKEECRVFENGGMRERLAVLRKKFQFHLTHHREVLSLYEVRNVFSHFDGVVDNKFCNQDGHLEVSWPQNTYKLKKRGKNELVPYRKVRKPFSSEVYESVQIKWLSQPETRRYKPHDIIKLSYKDLNDLLLFYLEVFNELHARLVDNVKQRGLKVRPFEEYRVVTHLCFASPES